MGEAGRAPEERAPSLGPTLIERIVGLLPLPYPIAALILGAIAGPPLYFLAQFLDGGPVNLPSDPEGVAVEILYFVLPTYTFLAVWYMRRRIVAAEPELQSLSPDGEHTYVRAFHPLTRPGPPLALTAVLLGIVLYAYAPNPRRVSDFVQLASIVVANFGYASVIWVYASSIWGLYTLGTSALRLKPYYEDTLLGVRVMGSLSLAFVFAYFGEVLIAGLLFFSNSVFLALLLALSLGGILLFFLPLVRIHRRMVEARTVQQAAIGARYKDLLRTMDPEKTGTDDTTLADVRMILAHDLFERKVLAISTWPFDTAVLREFTVIIVSVIAILLSRIMQIALHL